MLFEVELINISDSPPTANVFKEIDSDHDNQLSREEVRAMARSLSFFLLRVVHGDGSNININLRNM